MLVTSPSLKKQQDQNLHRKRPCVRPLERNLMEMEGELYLNFSSNDYLGLSQDIRVIEALCESAQANGAGSTGSRMICGHQPAHSALEQAFATWLGYEEAILFSNGYMANLGIFEALGHLDASFCLDKFCHTSLINGARFTQKPLLRYQHLDEASLTRQLHSLTGTLQKFVITEGLFSMEGDRPALDTVFRISQNNQAELIIDDAHAIGVMGKTGRGSLECFGLTSSEVPLLIIPLGKAFGTYGAMVLTNAYYRELILQFASSYTYTTNIPAAMAHASLESLRIVQTEPWRRDHLQANIHFFQNRAAQLGLEIPLLNGPIQIIPAPDNRTALKLHEELKSKGFFVQAIRSPSVPMNHPRLRITLNCQHETEDIDRLLQCIIQAKQSC